MVRGTVFGTRIGARKEGRQRCKENKIKRERKMKRNRGYSRLRALGECVRRGNESMEKESLIRGTWNVRGLGGPYVRLDPYLKMRCILTLCETRGGSFCTLSGLKFRENGVREYATKKQKWLLIV